MHKQTVQFAAETKDGAIQNIGKATSILQPKINFKGGSIKWLPDKPKSKSK